MSSDSDFLRAMIAIYGKVDSHPKNGAWSEERKEPRVEWYKPYKHKDKLIDALHYCMLTGYEMDKTPFSDNYNNTNYTICLGGLTIHISFDDFLALRNEATESFDVAKIIERHQVRIYEKQPEHQEVLRNYIVPHSVASQGTSAISKHSPLYESLKKK